MGDFFTIWVDRLKNGQTQKIRGPVKASFLEIDEPELRFPKAVAVDGEAYVSAEHLVIRLKAATEAEMPCSVCNKMIDVKLEIDDFYHTEALEEIPSSLFDFRNLLREALLIELPKVVECRGQCPERAALASFLRSRGKSENPHHFPFKEL